VWHYERVGLGWSIGASPPLLSASKKIFVKRSFQLRFLLLGLLPHWKKDCGYDIKYVASLYFIHAMPSGYLRKQQTQDGSWPMV